MQKNLLWNTRLYKSNAILLTAKNINKQKSLLNVIQTVMIQIEIAIKK